MKLYISDSDEKVPEVEEKFDIVPEMDECDQVLILPGGLGAFHALFQAIDQRIDTIIYNKDMYYASVIKNLYEAYQKGKIQQAPFDYLDIESDLDEIIRKLEEKENGKTNNGKTSKLL